MTEASSFRCFATGRRFLVRRDSTCSTQNVIYVAFCKICGKQGVGSTTGWKKRLANYKSHINCKRITCRIVKHFVEVCNVNAVENIGFMIVDHVNNTGELTVDELDDLLLQKEKFWIGSLLTHRHGINGMHDWNRAKRSEREKLT